MTIDFADFARASNLAHLLQGAALAAAGAAEAYAADNHARRPRLAAGAFMALCGLGSFLVVLALPGGWSLEQLSAALHLRTSFYLFIALACLFSAAGLSLLTRAVLDREAGGWQFSFLGLLAFAAAVYVALAYRVNEDARLESLVWHAAFGVTLLLAVAAKAAHLASGRRSLQLGWAVLLLASGLQLAVYREHPESFAPKLVTVEAGSQTQPPAPQNAPADKKRTADRPR